MAHGFGGWLVQDGRTIFERILLCFSMSESQREREHPWSVTQSHFGIFEKVSCYAAEAGFQFTILLPPSGWFLVLLKSLLYQPLETIRSPLAVHVHSCIITFSRVRAHDLTVAYKASPASSFPLGINFLTHENMSCSLKSSPLSPLLPTWLAPTHL